VPVVVNPADPKPDQAKLGVWRLATHINVSSVVLELLKHRVFNGRGGDRWLWAALPTEPVGAAAVTICVSDSEVLPVKVPFAAVAGRDRMVGHG
jgi:hypothetical protein